MLYGTFQYNTALYNGSDERSVDPSTDLVVFDGFSLNDQSSTFTTGLVESAPSREVIGGNVPRGDGMYTNADYWRKKVIEVRGIVSKSSRTLLEQYLDTMRKALRERDQNLDITRTDDAGATITVRRYTATLINPEELFSAREGYHTTTCPFVARFECRTPFAEDTAYTVVSETITVSPTNKIVENLGSIEGMPIVSLTFDSATDVTVVNVKRIDADGTTLDEIEYSGTVAANDVLKFDSETKTVKKNGTEVNYTGGFPVLDTGSNIIRVTITGVSFSAVANYKHKNRYL
jgi:phage-related protein